MTTDPTLREAALSPAKRALLEELRKGQRGANAKAARIPRRAATGPIPVSFAQQRLWFIHQIDPLSPAYNVPTALRLLGALDTTVLARCLEEITRRHESLRTRFEDSPMGPVQIVEDAGPVPLPIFDLGNTSSELRQREVEQRADAEASKPFDLARGPLLRAQVLRLSEDDHVFLLTMHHIVSDGWSTGILVREIAALYDALAHGRASPLPELPIQYPDFSIWQREHLSGARLEGELSYWRDVLTPLPRALLLPADRPRPPVQSFRGGSESVSLPSEVADGVRNLAREEGATLFMALVAAFDALLFRLTGEEDLAIGTGIANRTWPEIEPLIGFFVNALVLRVSCSQDPSFRTLLGRAREVTLGAFAHQDLPFERLVEELQPSRDLSRNPIFQVALALQNAPLDEFELPGLTVQPVASLSNATRFDLEFHLWEDQAGGIDGFLFYSSDLFDAATVRRIARQYETLLSAIVAQPEAPLSRLRILTREDDAAIQRLGRGEVLARPAETVLDSFARQVAERPNAIALEHGQRRVSYRELDTAARALAAQLAGVEVPIADIETRIAGVESPVACTETRIAVLADRSIEQVAGVLAVLMAGAAYVPLDPANPDPRLSSMLERAHVRLALCSQAFQDRAALSGVRVVVIEEALRDSTPGTATRLVRSPSLDQLAYIIFTSGSTGEPNGVEVTHANLANLVAWHRHAFALTPGDRATLIAGVGFDASVWELWPCLATGASVCIPDDAQRLDPPTLRDWLIEREITVTFLPTPLAELVLVLDWPRSCPLRVLLTGGDRLHAVSSGPLPFRLVNNYGPTETTVVATSGTADRGAALPVPSLGKPIANTSLHVLDAQLQSVPLGVAGELYIGGAGVARGYTGRPELTAARFLPDPFSNQSGARLYRTGDRVRQLPDGRIEFLGRVDSQTKIRGQRIEPIEIEAVLAAHPRVDSVAVVVQGEANDARLVAYVTARRDDEERWHGEHVARWRDLYDQTYTEAPEAADRSFNIIGWNSSYTGEPIPPEEMREWRDRTVERIRELDPRRVLEIGCGTGLLLTQIAPACERYVATDLSRVSLDFVRRTIAERPDLEHVELLERTADVFAGLAPESFDTVILNSVIQYFPDRAYLEQVLSGALERLQPGGCLFIGDVRDLRLHRAFAASIESARSFDPRADWDPSADSDPSAGSGHAEDAWWERVERRLAHEEELLVHPAFFGHLARNEPRGATASALVKHGRADNELTRFRYDAIVRVHGGADPTHVPGATHVTGATHVPGDRAATLPNTPLRIDTRSAVGLAQIRWEEGCIPRIETAFGDPRPFVVCDIPNARLVRYVRAASDAAPNEPFPVEEQHPDALLALGRSFGFVGTAMLSPMREDLFDVLFVPLDSVGPPAPIRGPWPLPSLAHGLPLTNTPLRVTVAGSLVPELREHAAARLPEAMVPAAFVVLSEMPLTPNGKIDRRALPAPTEAARPVGEWIAPRTETEREIARIWSDVIGVPRVSAVDDFFDLGGHSLLATQVLSRLRTALGVEIPLRALFEASTVEALAVVAQSSTQERTRSHASFVDSGFPSSGAVPADVAGKQPGGIVASDHGQIPRLARTRAPLSLAQQRLWFLDRLEPGGAAYNIPSAITLNGPLDVTALSRAVREILRRHEALRTRFVETGDGPVQEVVPTPDLALSVETVPRATRAERLALLRQWVQEESVRPFDLTHGPMLRVRLWQVAPDEHVLTLVAHHIVSDGWSMGILVRELSALYAALPLPEPPIQYPDWSIWQRDWLARGPLERQLAYWRTSLAGVEPLVLPADHARPAHPSYRGSALDLALDPGLVDRVQAFARSEGATLHMALLAAFAAVLARWSGQSDFAIGTPVAGRTREETEALVGFFVNTLALRLRMDCAAAIPSEPSYRDLLRLTRETALAAYAHQDVPFERIVEDLDLPRDTSRNPVFQVLFALHNVPFGELSLPGLEVRSFEFAPQTAQFDLEISLFHIGNSIQGRLHWSTDLFELRTMKRFAAHFSRLLASAVTTPDCGLGRLPLLSEEERQYLVRDLNRTRRVFSGPWSLVAMFEDAVRRHPHAIALRLAEPPFTDTSVPSTDAPLPSSREAPSQPGTVHETQAQITYAELDAAANRLAHFLAARGVSRGAQVGLCLERGLDLITSVLALRKAGAAYVPLDPAYPPERLLGMMEDADLAAVLTTSALAPSVSQRERCAVLSLDRVREELACHSEKALNTPTSPDDLVYIIFTSGSTGRPKGVAMRQGALLNLIAWQRDRSEAARRLDQSGTAPPARPTLQYSSLSFDVSFQEIFSTFAESGTLVLVSEEVRRDPVTLLTALQHARIERIFLPFVALQALAETAEERTAELALTEVITAGEQLRITPAIRRFFQRYRHAMLDNHYGPSETHVATAERVDGDPAEWPELPAIGRPLANTSAYVLDVHLEPVPLRAVGEVYLGGAHLARGYFGRADLTAERFLPDPFSSGGCLYRTGDLGRVLEDGRIEFLGRRDRQVKVRGYRVEPAEIESTIARLTGVRAVAVEARPDAVSGSRLLAYVVLDETWAGRTVALRAELARLVPEYLVPAVWVELQALPLTPSGKVDRRALPDPEPAPSTESHVLSALEEVVADAFAHALGGIRDERGSRVVAPVDSLRSAPLPSPMRLHRDTHFFELGGHSLLATRVVARLSRITGVDLPLRTVFEQPTVRDLALSLGAALRGSGVSAPSTIPRLPRLETRPVFKGPLSFQQERLWFLHLLDPGGSGFNITAALGLRGHLDEDAIRLALTDLAVRHESLRTRFETSDGVPVQVVDPPQPVPLLRIDFEKHSLERTIELEARVPFDLESGPLWRVLLGRTDSGEHILRLVMHHIVTDGWSMGILVSDLGRLYEARAAKSAVAQGADSPSAEDSLPALPIQYADYASWQRAWLGAGELDRQLGYWRHALQGIEAIDLPADRPRPPVSSQRGFHVRCELSSALASRLGQLARAEGATLHMVLLAAYSLLLARWSGARTLAVGIPVANRTREETEGLIGYFVNTLAVRVEVTREDDTATARDLVHRVRESTLGAYAHQDVPFESVLEAVRPQRDLSRSPVFQTWFNLVNVPEEEPRFGSLTARALGTDSAHARFDLSLYAFETGHGILLDAVASQDLFDPWRIQEMLDQLEGILKQFADDPTRALAEISLRTEKAELELPNEAQPLSEEWRGSVHDLFAARAQQNPAAPAVIDASTTWSYGELDARTNQLARWLSEHGVRPGDPVAIYAHRSGATVWAMLGVLKAGAATVMLDPAHPSSRLLACLEEARPRAWIEIEAAGPAPRSLREFVETNLSGVRVALPGLHEGEARNPFRGLSKAPVAIPTGPADTACITFTSGSTGKPKGVRGGHGSLTHFQPFLERRFGIQPHDRFSMLSGLAHDPLQRDVFTALLAGASIHVPAPEEIDPARLASWVREHRITMLCLTPAMAKVLTTSTGGATESSIAQLPSVRFFFMLGEQLTRSDVLRLQAIAPNASVVNLYGTTETQRASAYFIVPPGVPPRDETGALLEREIIPAGVGMDDVQLLIRGEGGRAAGLCELGEIWTRSPHLAPGYLDPALTRDRFGTCGGARVYRTGDLGRYLPGGIVQVEGRRDGQVNVRGFRVELGEVEAALVAHADVRDAVVALAGEGRLVGYVTPNPGRPVDARAVREGTRSRLPDYMVPAAVVVLEALPLTPNGKVDRAALPEPTWTVAGAWTPPRTVEEEVACSLFGEILRLERVGAEDDFFDLGGHSLLATRLLSRARAAFAAEISLRAFFEAPTPLGLARAATTALRSGHGTPPPVTRAEEGSRRLLSHAQLRLWFLDHLAPNSAWDPLESTCRHASLSIL